MRSQRGARGRFSSLYGTMTLRLGGDFPFPAGGPRYERLVFDCDGQLIVGPNEWYRLMHGVGAARTRETYLAVLRPWVGFLGRHGYPWNAQPDAVREYTRLFLIDAGCVVQAGRVDGWFVQATSRSPLSNSGLHLLFAALRSFYWVMRRGVFDDQEQRFPRRTPTTTRCTRRSCSPGERNTVSGSATPELPTTRESDRNRGWVRAEPVGFLQVKRHPLEPPPGTRRGTDTPGDPGRGALHDRPRADPRGGDPAHFAGVRRARVCEVLGLTAGGIRRAQSPKIGIDVAALVRVKGEHTISKPIWCSAETRDQRRRYVARERSRLDPSDRTRLEELDDDDASSSPSAGGSSATPASASCSTACSAKRSDTSDYVGTTHQQCRSRCRRPTSWRNQRVLRNRLDLQVILKV
jgi:hypothetical protein